MSKKINTDKINRNNNINFGCMMHVMYTHSDEINGINKDEIKNLLKDYKVELSTNTLEKYLKNMVELGQIIEMPIIKKEDKEEEKKGVFYYACSDKLGYSELKLISDCVCANKSLTLEKTSDILTKLYTANKSKMAEYSLNLNNLVNRSKSSNEDILKSIEVIYDAIAFPKKISFEYYYYNTEVQKLVKKQKKYEGIPINLAIRNEYYYLLFRNHDKTIGFYRIDKIKNVKKLEEELEDNEEGFLKRFDATAFIKKSIKSFCSEEEVRVKLKFEKKWIAGYLKDELGEECRVRCEGDEIIANFRVFMSEGLVNWIMSMGSDVEVIEPQKLREKINNRALDIANLYKETENTSR